MQRQPGMVIQIDPGDVLSSRTDPASESHSERKEELAERASRGRQDEAGPHVNGPDPRAPGRVGSRLPLAADLGQESRARAALLCEPLLAPVSVEADRGGDDEHPGRMAEARQGTGEQVGSLLPALDDPPLLGRCPPEPGDRLARQMHDGMHAFERSGRKAPRRGVPLDPVGTPTRRRMRAGNADYPEARHFELGRERRSDEASAAGDSDPRAIVGTVPLHEREIPVDATRAKLEETGELPPDLSGTEECSERPCRPAPLDGIHERSTALGDRFESVCMAPALEGAPHLPVHDESGRIHFRALEFGCHADRPLPDAEHNPVPGRETGRARHDPDAPPWGEEAEEGTRAAVPREDAIRRVADLKSRLESRHLSVRPGHSRARDSAPGAGGSAYQIRNRRGSCQPVLEQGPIVRSPAQVHCRIRGGPCHTSTGSCSGWVPHLPGSSSPTHRMHALAGLPPTAVGRI